MIGMSLYPYWAEMYHNQTAEQTISGCMANIKRVSAKYGCDVMIVETGMLCADEQGKLVSAQVHIGMDSQLASSWNNQQVGRCSAVGIDDIGNHYGNSRCNFSSCAREQIHRKNRTAGIFVL